MFYYLWKRASREVILFFAFFLPPERKCQLERRLRGKEELRRLGLADVVIVSFGKSGRTWLRVLLSRFFQLRFGLRPSAFIGFDNLHRRHEGIPRIFFTHDNYLRDFTGNLDNKRDFYGRKVVLLVRQPEDVAVSQFHQWKFRMRPHKMDLNRYPSQGTQVDVFNFVMDEDAGLPKVIDFMNGWAKELPRLQQLLIIRYEDLRRDTAGELRRVLEFMDQQPTDAELEDAHPVRLELPVRNVNRTVGTMLGAEVTRRYGAQGLPDDTIHVTLNGSAGQSVGAFLPPGITLDLVGDANDYVGKGLSGGRVIVRPPDDVLFLPEDHVIAGNTLLYGATSGEVFLRGRVGERFCARNSGALAVTEGVGDHACEYMTGGRVVVLGRTGRNLAAGMSGGIAYVLGLVAAMVNTEMVELQRLEPEDFTWLHDVVARHARLTGSTLAASVLSDWPRRSAQFTKIMARDYQRVLTATRMAKAEGRDVDTAIMEASRG